MSRHVVITYVVVAGGGATSFSCAGSGSGGRRPPQADQRRLTLYFSVPRQTLWILIQAERAEASLSLVPAWCVFFFCVLLVSYVLIQFACVTHLASDWTGDAAQCHAMQYCANANPKKVGWIFAHPPREEGFLFSSAEVITAATLQLEAADGVNDTPFVTVKVGERHRATVGKGHRQGTDGMQEQ